MENENLTNDDLTPKEKPIGEILKKTGKKKITPKKVLKMAFLFMLLLVVWFALVQYLAADKYGAVVKVVEEGGKIGVNPTAESLDYGDLPKGNALTRFITVENNGDLDVYVMIAKVGGISELIKIDKNNFVLSSGDSAKIELLLEMPISADKEGYEGKVIIFKLPKLF